MWTPGPEVRRGGDVFVLLTGKSSTGWCVEDSGAGRAQQPAH